MTTTTLPSMIVDDIDLRERSSLIKFKTHPVACGHVWEPHLWESGRAYCAQCGSLARWVNDPRLAVAS